MALAASSVSSAETDPGQVKPVAYKVVDGNKVDNDTLQGWRTWRALACERCHGAKQEGMVGPSLVDALKTLDKNEFHRTVFGGRVDKGMPDFSASQMMQKNWENLYAYLKGRSDGKINPGDLHAIDAK
ncbi:MULTISPECIES: c-type cytochrome [unclassified Caballeronia]|uniref:c-type cytochrome n=1 Tax=unclassified Caballeronia TaxID=2646786 RepID=UPI00385769C1